MENLNLDKSSWKKVNFGDVVVEPKETCKDILGEGIEHVVGLEHIDSGDLHLRNSATIEESTTFTKKFKKGDVLFGRRRAYLKKAAQAEFDGICSGDITVFRTKKEKLLPELLPFVVHNDKFFDYAIKHSAGGLSPRVKFKDLANYEFLLPPKEEQAKLAELLWAMDEVIEREKGGLEKSMLLYRTFQFKFFNDKTNIEQKILDVAEVKRGKFTPRPRNDPKFFGGEIPFIQTGEVVGSEKWIKTYSQTLNELGISVSKMFERETIVMTIAANIGYVGMLDFDSAFTDSLVGIKAFRNKLLQEYLYFYLEYKRQEIESLATESAQKNLSIEGFSNFYVRYPESVIEQAEIVNTLEELRTNSNLIKSKISSSQTLLKSLINQIF